MFFDTHSHYDDMQYDTDRHEIIARAHNSGIIGIINAAASLESTLAGLKLAERYDFIHPAAGIHPQNVIQADEKAFSVISGIALEKSVVAIGETGLDYHYDPDSKKEQISWFRKHIRLALESRLPLIIHDREAHTDVLNVVREENAKLAGGVFHCFSGSVEMAEEVLKEGFYISVAGPVTFKNAKNLPDVVRAIPIEKLLIETDCPYLSPEPERGKRNDSSKLVRIAEAIAAIKGISIDEVAKITTGNAKALFKIL
jgi:TatD DNase family protein